MIHDYSGDVMRSYKILSVGIVVGYINHFLQGNTSLFLLRHCWVSLGVRPLVKRCNMKAKTASWASPVAGVVLLESNRLKQVWSLPTCHKAKAGMDYHDAMEGPSLYSKDVFDRHMACEVPQSTAD